RFADAAQEKRLKEIGVGAVHQQIRMMAPIGRQQLLKDERQHRLSLMGVAEGAAFLLERIQFDSQRLRQRLPRRLLGVRGEKTEGVVKLAGKANVGPS